MNLNHLHYFRVLAKTEHYTQAANQLDITQPSLSHAIAALEKDLGCYLFEKQGRNIKLTKYGRIFYEYIDKGLQEVDLGERRLRELTSQETDGSIWLLFIPWAATTFPICCRAFWHSRKTARSNSP